MTGSITAAPAAHADQASELERLGIVTTTATFFHWKGYRYTSARDALQAATRAEAAEGSAIRA